MTLRRLIFERRIAYHKDRRRVRLTSRDLDAYVRGLRVEASGDDPLSAAVHSQTPRRR